MRIISQFTKAFLIVILLITTSCMSKKKTAPPEGSVTVTGIGPINFGNVVLGEYRVAGILIKNDTSTSKNIAYPTVSAPFNIYNPTSTCTSALASMSSCVIGISFSPLTRQTYSAEVTVLDNTISFTGKGTTAGVLSSSPTSWAISTTAGQAVNQTFTIYNDGDQSLPFPKIQNINDAAITSNFCGLLLTPNSSCDIMISFQRNTSGVYNDILTFSTTDGTSTVTSNVAVTSTLIPSNPDGAISFSNVPSTIIANGSDTHTINATVLDMFSNVVAEGTIVDLVGVNITLASGNTAVVTNGKISFQIISTSNKAITPTVTASSDNAYGQLVLNIGSGEAVGEITTQTFNHSIKSNGISSVTITTNQILDADENVIDDGKTIYFALTGPGTLNHTSFASYNGKASVTVTSPLTTGSASLVISANPIYSNNTIIGYAAQSASIPLTYTPGYPSGSYILSCDKPSIYYEVSNDNFLSTKGSTVCMASSILDSNGNLVGAGSNVNFVISNGIRCSDSSVAFTLTTDSSSSASFTLCGNSTRSLIQISAETGGTSVETSVYAAAPLVKKYEPYNNNLQLYRGYGPSTFSASNIDTKPPSVIGSKMQKYKGDLGALTVNDTDVLGSVTISAPAQTLLYNFPRLLGLDCLQNVGSSIQLLPCFYFFTSSSTYFWGNSGTYNIGYDDYLGVLNITTVNKKLGASDAHGNYQNIFSNQFYNASSDTYQVQGGIQYSGTTSFTTEVNNIMSQIYYPLSFKTSFDIMTYRNETSSLPYMMSTYSTPAGDTYLYGGVNSDGTLASAVYKTIKDLTTGLGIKTNQISVTDDPAYGHPIGLVGAGIYINEADNYLYLIGGRKRVSGVWANVDQIWKFDTSNETPTWSRVCNSCGLPSVSITNWASKALFPLTSSVNTPTIFDELTTYSNQIKIQKDINGDIIYHAEASSFYKLNLNTGATILITDTNDLAYFNDTTMFQINQLTGRKMAFSRGLKTTSDSKIKFFETARGTKAHFISKFTLDDDAYRSAIRFNVTVSGFSWAKDDVGVNDYGMRTYIYNFTTSLWELLGTNFSQDAYDSYTKIATYTVSTNATHYVDNNNNVYVLNTAKGTPSCYIDSGCGNNGLSELRINYIELSGEF